MVKKSDYTSSLPEKATAEDYFHEDKSNPQERDLKVQDRWWNEFEDSVLEYLMYEAERSNRTVEIARENLIKSRFAVIAASLGFLPTGGLNYNFYNFNNPLFGPGIDLKLFQAGFDAQWEADIWGKTLDRHSAAKFRNLRVMQNHNNVLLSLYAEISKTYFQLRKNQEAQKNATKRLDAYVKIAVLHDEAFRSGIINEGECLRSKLEIEQETIKLRDLEVKVKSLIFQLSFLIGKLPEELDGKLNDCVKDFLDYKTEVVPIGLRSDLLKRRPDIKMAEYELAATIDDASLASKDFLPSFQFSGSELFSSKALTGVFTGKLITNITAGFKLPIFNMGTLIAQYKIKKSDARIALLQYEQVVLEALKNTESSLMQYLSNIASEYNSSNYLTLVQKIYLYKLKMNQIGNINDIEMVKSEVELLNARDMQLDFKEKSLISLVALHKELGGGFDKDIIVSGEEVIYKNKSITDESRGYRTIDRIKRNMALDSEKYEDGEK